MDRNIARLSAHLGRLGVPLRPHLKTAKCVDIARPMMATPAGPATVSTLKEAEEFAAAGVSDIVYAVGIAPSKLERALALRKASGVEGIGVRTIDDIALSVPANVIGHQPAKKQILVDAGWMALSRDRGTANQPVDQYHGLVCDASGRPYPDLIMRYANQEHGVLELRPGSAASLPELPVGTLVRILPNHACATAAQHRHYNVIRNGRLVAQWPRIPSGW